MGREYAGRCCISTCVNVVHGKAANCSVPTALKSLSLLLMQAEDDCGTRATIPARPSQLGTCTPYTATSATKLQRPITSPTSAVLIFYLYRYINKKGSTYEYIVLIDIIYLPRLSIDTCRQLGRTKKSNHQHHASLDLPC